MRLEFVRGIYIYLEMFIDEMNKVGDNSVLLKLIVDRYNRNVLRLKLLKHAKQHFPTISNRLSKTNWRRWNCYNLLSCHRNAPHQWTLFDLIGRGDRLQRRNKRAAKNKHKPTSNAWGLVILYISFFFFNAIYGVAVMEHSQSPRETYSFLRRYPVSRTALDVKITCGQGIRWVRFLTGQCNCGEIRAVRVQHAVSPSIASWSKSIIGINKQSTPIQNMYSSHECYYEQ